MASFACGLQHEGKAAGGGKEKTSAANNVSICLACEGATRRLEEEAGVAVTGAARLPAQPLSGNRIAGPAHMLQHLGECYTFCT